jgi:hypothetical protein
MPLLMTLGLTCLAMTGMIGRSDWVQNMMDTVIIRTLAKISFWGCLSSALVILTMGYAFN